MWRVKNSALSREFPYLRVFIGHEIWACQQDVLVKPMYHVILDADVIHLIDNSVEMWTGRK